MSKVILKLSARIIGVLRELAVPVSTPDLAALLGKSRGQVWTELCDLAGAGVVEKRTRRDRPRSRAVKFFGRCAACKCPRFIVARDLCNRCYDDPCKRPTGPRRVHTMSYWRLRRA
jgi:hypothetical protein